MQVSMLCAQAVLERKDVPAGIALMFFGQTLGGAIFVSVAQNVLDDRLAQSLSNVPGFSPKAIVAQGATDLRWTVQPQYLGRVVEAYNDALVNVFYIMVAMASLSIFGSVLLKWSSLKKEKGASGPAGAQLKPQEKAPA